MENRLRLLKITSKVLFAALALPLAAFQNLTFAEQQGEFFPYIGLRTDASFTVTDTVEDSPARKAGLMRGDRIVSINGNNVEQMAHSVAIRNMRGAPGSAINLTIDRGSQSYSVSMIRMQMPPTHKGATNDTADDLDRRMIRIIEHTPLTDQVYSSVTQGLSLLPPKVKRSFFDAGIRIIITPSVDKVDGVTGTRTEYSPKLHSVIVCEQNSDGTKADLPRLNLIILHELGHAFDQINDYPSRGTAFHALYEKEAPLVAGRYQQILSYFLQPGEPGPRECFASLFACKYYSGDDKRLTALRTSFPQTFDYVQALHF